MRSLLFLCTANYYRSRFAELLFNSLAAKALTDWSADSCGIATELGVNNIGPISVLAVQGLRVRGVEVGESARLPQQVQVEHFAKADLVIAMDELEHRPMMAARYPEWVDKIEYWRVADLHAATAADALALAEREIRMLIERLAQGSAKHQASSTKTQTT